MRRFFYRVVRAITRLVKRLIINQPRNAYEGIVFEAVFATQAELKKRGM